MKLADRLWEARKLGGVVRKEDIVEPVNTEEAYAVQSQIVRLSGYEMRGFKVGSTSKEAQRLLGTSEPGSAPILAPYLHTTPARVPIVPLQTPAVEGEFAFRLGQTSRHARQPIPTWKSRKPSTALLAQSRLSARALPGGWPIRAVTS